MMKTRQEIKADAKAAMSQQRGAAIFIMLALVAIMVAIMIVDFILEQALGLVLISWLVYIPAMCILYVLIVNSTLEFVKIYTNQEASVNSMFANLNVNFLRKLGGMWWMSLWIMLWWMLFVIPGIIKLISYSLTYYILADCPDVTARQALKLSMRMTHGHKGAIFVFMLSFFGWFLLSSLTLGIAYVVHVGPYYETSFAGLYVELRDEALRNGTVSAEELGITASGTGTAPAPMGNFN